LVRTHPPDDNRGMVAVANDHVVHIAHEQIFPSIVAEIAPAGRFFPDHEAELITSVEECYGLRVMRTANDIAVEVATQHLGVAPQHARGHRAANVRVDLMAIETKKLQVATVEEKAVQFEPRITQADTEVVVVQRLAMDEQRGDDIVKMRRIDVPEF